MALLSPKIPASLFFRPDGYSLAEITFDLVLEESHSLQSEISTHPLENGAVIADHVRNKLREGKFTAMVSNYSLASSVGFLSENRAADAWEQMKTLWETREPVTITTVLEVYDNVIITEISTERTGDSGESLSFQISFSQIRQVSLSQVTIEAATNPQDLRTDNGRQASSKASAGRTKLK